jgi:hypothetical protein
MLGPNLILYRGLSMNNRYIEVSESMSKMAGLNYDPQMVNFEINSDDIPFETLKYLKMAGIAHLNQKAPFNDDIHNTQDSRDLESLHHTRSIEDLLGAYFPENRIRQGKIVIYEKVCDFVSEELAIDNEALIRLAIAHEIAHAISHLGKDKKDKIWSNFNQAESAEKEYFAQMYALLYFREVGDRGAEVSFHVLEAHQPEEYRSWKNYSICSLDMLTGALLWVRGNSAETKMPLAIKVKIVPPNGIDPIEFFEVQNGIKEIEKEIDNYRTAHNPTLSSRSDIADLIGKRKEYSALLRRQAYFEDP